ncbi:hypothetical protein [Dawidia soli]|uniref:Uncharacterized protein n=1 Tax=Dawidia soli TaxID=2782352 RepID=A0AAP2DFM5_9BACT|nr:hypothetical protein [Dawidia soli]MBT1688452.1 hypothetical protein [Dawidia soli]
MEYLRQYNKIYCVDDGVEIELLLYDEGSRHAVWLKPFDVRYHRNFDIGFSHFLGTEIYDREFILEGIRGEYGEYYIKLQNGDVVTISSMPYGNSDVICQVVSIYHETIHRQIWIPGDSNIYASMLRRYQHADDVEVLQDTL